ncbi:MAG: hypothetical protein ACP5EQ_07715 [Candidatus Cloacimonadia bacterium]
MVNLRFVEDFCSNKKHWRIVDNENIVFQFKGNKALFENLQEEDYSIYVPKVDEIIDIAQYPIHNLSVTMCGKESSTDSWFGLIWGYEDANNFYVIIINPNNNTYQVNKVYKGEWMVIKKRTKLSESFSAKEYFDISINKNFNNWEYSIIQNNLNFTKNNRVFENPFGNHIGFITGPTSQMEISHFSLSRGYYMINKEDGSLLDLSKLRVPTNIYVDRERENRTLFIWDGTYSSVLRFAEKFKELEGVVDISYDLDYLKHLGHDITVEDDSLKLSKIIRDINYHSRKIVVETTKGEKVDITNLPPCTIYGIDKYGNRYPYAWNEDDFVRARVCASADLGYVWDIPVDVE